MSNFSGTENETALIFKVVRPRMSITSLGERNGLMRRQRRLECEMWLCSFCRKKNQATGTGQDGVDKRNGRISKSVIRKTAFTKTPFM